MKGVFGVRKSTLVYLMSLDLQIPIPVLMTVTVHPCMLGERSVKADKSIRLSHTYPLFNDNNAKFYRKL